METGPAFPESVSYRQLAGWMRQAPPDQALADATPADESQELDALLEHWSVCGQQLLRKLREAGPAVGQARSPRQLMALGALQAHLAMALQAHAASGRQPD